MSSLDYLDLCRLCLVKDRVSVPIFEGEGDVRQIFLKIAACLPVKVAREDKLPKKICDDCVYKVELFYQFWNTTVNAEKQLLQWLGEVNLEDKQNYVTDVLNPSVMKQEQQNSENRLDGTVMSGHQNNMSMGMMDNMGLGMPMIMSTNQQITSVPMDTSGSPVQSVQAVPGPSTQASHEQLSQNQTNATTQEEDEESSEEDDNSEDECDGDEGLPVKEESEEDPGSNRTIEPTTFVNVSLACDEAGPSGLQQQKIAEMPEMAMPQTSDGDPKTGQRSIMQRSKRQHRNTRCKSRIVNQRKNNTMHRNTRNNGSAKFMTSTDTKLPSIELQSEKKRGEANLHKPDTQHNTNDQEKEEIDAILDQVRHICPFCQKQFSSVKLVEHHVSHVHRIFKCDKCEKTCDSVHSLRKHMVVHDVDYFIECKICNMKYRTKQSLKRHNLVVHTDLKPEYICDYCNKRYMLKNELSYHIRKMHTTDLQVCPICGKIVRNVKDHEWRHQRRKRESKYVNKCHLCKKKFRHNIGLINHLDSHKEGDVKCEQPVKTCQKVEKVKTTKKESHECPICHKIYSTNASFYQHILTHAGVKLYKCDICERSFSRPVDFSKHRRKKHPDAFSYIPSTNPEIADIARNYLQSLKVKTEEIDIVDTIGTIDNAVDNT